MVRFIKKLVYNNKYISFIYSLLKRLLFIAFMVASYMIFGKYGLLGLLIAILLIMGFGIIKRRDLFMYQLRKVEEVIWKKPLDKDKWDKGEMKNTKVKVIWRKNDKQKEGNT